MIRYFHAALKPDSFSPLAWLRTGKEWQASTIMRQVIPLKKILQDLPKIMLHMKVQRHSSLSVNLRGNTFTFLQQIQKTSCAPRYQGLPDHPPPPTHTHTPHLSIHRHTKSQEQNIQAETNTDGYNYEKHDVLHNYRLIICDRRPHSRNDRSETSIYYGGFGLIFLQIFETATTIRGLKTFPLFSFWVWWWFKETFENSGFCNTPVGRERFLPARAKASSTPTLSDAYVHKHSQGISDTFQTPEREYENISVCSLVLIHETQAELIPVYIEFVNPFLRKLSH